MSASFNPGPINMPGSSSRGSSSRSNELLVNIGINIRDARRTLEVLCEMFPTARLEGRLYLNEEVGRRVIFKMPNSTLQFHEVAHMPVDPVPNRGIKISVAVKDYEEMKGRLARMGIEYGEVAPAEGPNWFGVRDLNGCNWVISALNH